MDFAIARRRLVESSLRPAGIQDERLLRIMGSLPRHRFVQEAFAMQAYADNSLPIGFNQTISKPTVVARMLEGLSLQKTDKVLEIGTGSAYQTAILSQLVRHVISVEVFAEFTARARGLLAQLHCENVMLRTVREGKDPLGFPAEAPFDAIVVSACLKEIPGALTDQLKEDGGRLVTPVQVRREQRIRLVIRSGKRLHEIDLGPCVFVPIAAAG